MRGAANYVKRRAIFDKHRFSADILICQETHSVPENELIWEREWGGKVIYSHGSSAARGVAIFTSREIYAMIKNVYTDMDGRLIIFDLHYDTTIVTFAAIYAPNEDRPKFFIDLEKILESRQEHKIVIGDFNLTLNVELDRENTYNNNNKAQEAVFNMMEHYVLVDVWRIHNPEKREFSWRKAKQWPTKASRIDFALVSAGLDQKIENPFYTTSVYTDHRAFYMLIELNPFERGKGYWKFNNTLLKDQEFLQMMNSELSNIVEDKKNPQEKWEAIKVRIKQKASKYSVQKNQENNLIISQLSEVVNEYESNLPLTKEQDQLLENSKKELEEKTLEKVYGIIFRSKVRWFEQGEKPTKYFLSLEKARYNAKTCFRMLDDNGKELNSSEEILMEQREFYSKLYEQDDFVNFTMTNPCDKKVPDEIRAMQDQQINMGEINEAMKTMRNDRTPGEDGIPVDFYKVFWNFLKKPFFEMMLYSFQVNSLHYTARQGILNLIPKAGKDSRYVKNLRPITLLNTDYKIIEKVIANKMTPALKEIIHPDQRGFMKERRISVNIRKMLDIIHLAEKEDIEAVILSLDFVKCFDKCSFKILHGSLDYFGFGKIVKEWTKILYTDFQVKVQNNGYFSQKIKVNKGVHQGGCCSSVYFLVIAEILAIALRQNDEIEGIQFKDIKNLLNQFADDMDVCSLATEKSIKAILEELEKFRLQSGFTVSYEKTTMYRIGSLRHSSAKNV